MLLLRVLLLSELLGCHVLLLECGVGTGLRLWWKRLRWPGHQVETNIVLEIVRVVVPDFLADLLVRHLIDILVVADVNGSMD